MRIDKERPINERLISIIKMITESRAPIAVSTFDDETRWGSLRTRQRMMAMVNDLWTGLYGNPLFQIVDSMGRPARRGERFYKAMDHSAVLASRVSGAYTVIPIISALGFLRVAVGSEVHTGIQNAVNLLQSDLRKREKDFLSRASKKFYYVGKGVKQYNKATKLTLDTIYRALIDEVLLEVTLSIKGKVDTRRIRPLSLILFNSGLYLLAQFESQERDGAPYTFKIETFTSVKILRNKPFIVPPSFDPAKYLDGGFGLVWGDASKAVEYTLEFSSKTDVQTYVKERQWTKSDVYKNTSNGKLQLTFKAFSPREVESWVLSFGEDCEVIGPPHFRDRIAKVVSGMGKIYGKTKKS